MSRLQTLANYGIILLPSNSGPVIGKEVKGMAEVLNFLLAVAASVVGYHISKWLDSKHTGW